MVYYDDDRSIYGGERRALATPPAVTSEGENRHVPTKRPGSELTLNSNSERLNAHPPLLYGQPKLKPSQYSSPAMSPPHFFSLSNELLIEIISELRPIDIHACQCACRRLNNVIVNSQLIQYILRTALSGIFDPLEPGISLPDRFDALERWETAWREMDLSKPITSIDALVHDVVISEPLVNYFGEQHAITCRTGFGVPAGYSFLDLRTWSSSPTNVTRWTTIDMQNPNVLSFALAPELNLSVAFSYVKWLHSHRGFTQPVSHRAPDLSDHRNITVVISPMWFCTGEPHPLASRSKLEVTVSRAAAHNLSKAMVIGDYILYWVGASIFSEIHEKSTLCNIYLVAWKEGWVSEVCICHTLMPAKIEAILFC